MAKRKKRATTKPLPWNGDHGTETALAKAGTELEELEGPNRMARRRRVQQSARWRNRLSNRQYQAALAIEEAYQRAQALGSGGDSIGKYMDLQCTVDSSPKPSATVAAQIDAVSRLAHVMSGVHIDARPGIEHIFRHQRPMRDFVQGRGHYNHSAQVKVALDLVANKLRY